MTQWLVNIKLAFYMTYLFTQIWITRMGDNTFFTSIFLNSVSIFYSHSTISSVHVFDQNIFKKIYYHNFRPTFFFQGRPACQQLSCCCHDESRMGLNQNSSCFSGKKSSCKCFTDISNVSHNVDSVCVLRSLLVFTLLVSCQGYSFDFIIMFRCMCLVIYSN